MSTQQLMDISWDLSHKPDGSQVREVAVGIFVNAEGEFYAVMEGGDWGVPHMDAEAIGDRHTSLGDLLYAEWHTHPFGDPHKSLVPSPYDKNRAWGLDEWYRIDQTEKITSGLLDPTKAPPPHNTRNFLVTMPSPHPGLMPSLYEYEGAL